jgi:hypothetical protein
VALTRCSGIILGVLVSILLAILVFPKSASHEAADNLARALEGLCSLCKLAWNSPTREDGHEEEGEGHCYVPLENGLLSTSTWLDAEAREAECEKVGIVKNRGFGRHCHTWMHWVTPHSWRKSQKGRRYICSLSVLSASAMGVGLWYGGGGRLGSGQVTFSFSKRLASVPSEICNKSPTTSAQSGVQLSMIC